MIPGDKKYTVVMEERDGVLSLDVIGLVDMPVSDLAIGNTPKEAINAFLIAKRNRLASLKNQIYMTEQSILLAEKMV